MTHILQRPLRWFFRPGVGCFGILPEIYSDHGGQEFSTPRRSVFNDSMLYV